MKEQKSTSEICGLSRESFSNLMKETGWSEEEAIKKIQILHSVGASIAEKNAISEALRQTKAYDILCEDLMNLNTMRGGTKGFKGFVAEPLQATKATVKGKVTHVIDNNGIADLEYIGENGHHYYQQMKIGYKPGAVDFSKYKGQTILIDKGNPHFKELKTLAHKQGVKLIESDVTNVEAQNLAKSMQLESKVLGRKTSTIVPKVSQGINVAKTAHTAGVKTAKSGAMAGAGFSIGSNLVDVACGDKEIGDAAQSIVKDTAVSYGVGYAVGTTATLAGSTTVGAGIASAAGTVGSTVAGNTVGGAVIGAGTAAGTAIGGVGTAATAAVVSTVGSVGSAVGGAAVAATAGTAVGGAVASGVAATTAIGAMAGTAAVAAAPVVVVGAAIGVGYKLLKKLWD